MKEIETCPCGIYVYDCTYHQDEAIAKLKQQVLAEWNKISDLINEHFKLMEKTNEQQ